MGLWQGFWRCVMFGMLRAIIATMELIWRFEQVYVKGCSYGFNSQCNSFIILCIPLYLTLSKMELVFKDTETPTSNSKHIAILFLHLRNLSLPLLHGLTTYTIKQMCTRNKCSKKNSTKFMKVMSDYSPTHTQTHQLLHHPVLICWYLISS